MPIKNPDGNLRSISPSNTYEQNEFSITMEVLVDGANNLIVRITNIFFDGMSYPCEAMLRLNRGAIEIYKMGFKICPANINSTIGTNGYFNTSIFQPTAGRDSLNDISINKLSRIVGAIEQIVSPLILSDSDLLANHIRMIPIFINQGKIDQLGKLKISTIDNQNLTLAEVKKKSVEGKRVFYTYSGIKTAASEVLSARGDIIVKLSSAHQRRQAEEVYLTKFCRGEVFDNMLECIEIYKDLSRFEKTIISELEYVIRKLFNPPTFKFITGKLSLDAPIYWSNKQESGKTIVFLDTRHGEFQKLKSLGFSSLLTSMIEAFCREYLSDTLKRQSTKFFGSGGLNFDSLSKSHAELWELLASDIEISRISSTQQSGIPHTAKPGNRGKGARISVIRSTDIAQVTITQKSGVREENPEINTPRLSPKILNIIDETKETGLDGYYLKIPNSATEAFGDLLKTFPSFAIVWFANRITWQISDLKNSAFLFDVSLDQIITAPDSQGLSHGSLELETKKIHSYANSLYLHIPNILERFIIPIDDKNPIKIEVRHELVDIKGARSWTSKDLPISF